MNVFVKIKDNRCGIKHDSWFFYCKDFMGLIEHCDLYFKTEIEKGISDVLKADNKHLITDYGIATSKISEIRGESVIDSSVYLENKVFKGKAKALEKFGHILLRENGSYMVLTSDHTIYDILNSDKLIYPEYSESDIKIVKWANGTHFYAKLGKMDIVDEEGNQKWDTWKEARKAVMKQLNNKL